MAALCSTSVNFGRELRLVVVTCCDSCDFVTVHRDHCSPPALGAEPDGETEPSAPGSCIANYLLVRHAVKTTRGDTAVDARALTADYLHFDYSICRNLSLLKCKRHQSFAHPERWINLCKILVASKFEVEPGNQPALRFYQRLGFEVSMVGLKS